MASQDLYPTLYLSRLCQGPVSFVNVVILFQVGPATAYSEHITYVLGARWIAGFSSACYRCEATGHALRMV